MALPLTAEQRRFAKGALIATLIVFALGFLWQVWFTRYWMVAFSPTKTMCLPWRGLLADTTLGQPVERGDLVWFWIEPEKIHAASALPLPQFHDGMKFAKMVAGVPGDVVDINATGIYVNDRYWGDLDLLPKLGYDAAHYFRHEVVPPEHLLLLGTAPKSFDGRYWGFVPLSRIIGKAEALL